MNEHLYTIPSGVIALALLVSMGLTKEIGYRAGLRKGRVGEKEAKDHIHAIQNSILGILALLLGFTFSLALQRFDDRSEAVVEEANAIGNAWLRATLLLSSAIVGYAAGVVGHRPSVVSYLMVALVVVLVFIILDLDRPRRGFIEVSQKSLLEVRATMGGAGGSPAP